jgi:hypothetical protein
MAERAMRFDNALFIGFKSVEFYGFRVARRVLHVTNWAYNEETNYGIGLLLNNSEELYHIDDFRDG